MLLAHVTPSRGNQRRHAAQKHRGAPTGRFITVLLATALVEAARAAGPCPLLDWNFCARVVFLSPGEQSVWVGLVVRAQSVHSRC